ncbi:MAG TPA: ABC transporter permease [Vicinamibacterales bacterium]|nr:ABC transporter permease [Vicinamibacterales bacterium]
MDRLVQDLRFAVRLLWKDRSFSLTTIATLALCLAANVAIFAVVSGVLLKPLPFPEPDRLVRLFNKYPGAGVDAGGSNGVPDYFDRRRDMSALEEQALFREQGVTISGNGLSEAERVQSLLVTPSFFRVLKAQPYRGQLFTDAHGELGQEKVVILSHGFWQRLFAGRDDAVGQDLRLGGELYKIVGVMPPGFVFLDPDTQLFRPAAFTAREKSDESRHSNNWQQFGRLKPGATLEQAQSQLDAINAANLERFPQWREILKNARFSSEVVDFQTNLIGERRSTLTMLWGGAIFVLLIGCVNVANLVLVRSTSRIRELATRHAMGATFGRLTRQALTESTALSIAGGVTGLALGWWALRAAPFFGFDRLPSGLALGLDAPVIGFTVALIALVGIGVGMIPVIAMRRANMAQVIREEGRSGTQGRGPRLMRRVLVTSQVAFALMLLIGAGVLLASFDRVLTIDPGFRSSNVLTGTISMPSSRYKDDAALRATTDRLLERIRAVPGVESAGMTTTLPFGGSYSDSVILAEGYQMSPGESLISPAQVIASQGYFEAMGTTLVAGRYFNADDTEGRQRVLIIDNRLARRFWPNGDAVGKRMYFPDDIQNIMARPKEDQLMTIVGIIEPMRLRGLVDTQAQKTGAYYSPLRQALARTVGLAIRTTQSPESVSGAVRREISQIDPEMPFYDVRTLEDRVSSSLMDRRTPMILATGFAIVALFLAAIGIYGVLAYQVSQRRREIGIRMALGAESSSIFNLVLKEGGLIVGLGAVFGLVGAFFLRQTLQAQLYETGAMDPRVITAVAGTLIAVAMIACVLPARRAAKTDPLIALTDQ